MHWFDELFQRIETFLGKKGNIVCSAGLSVSGLQHVGRLRGEAILPNVVAEELRKSGKVVEQYLVLYTQDAWKGKEGQLSRFKNGEGTEYINRRLIDVPDPEGCCSNWVEHYWHDFGDYLDNFAKDIQIVTTTQLYATKEMKKIVLDVIDRKKEVGELLNKYRTRAYPDDWIPFEPYCESCKKIGVAKTLAVDDSTVAYECSCGHSGKSKIEQGKLNWRMEWAALWKLLAVDIEPYGKDHATPGGSRDSCVELSQKILRNDAPFGISYEWVGLILNRKDMGDMSSSDFLGFTPKQWLEVGEGELLRYLYLRSNISKRIALDLSKMDSYYELFDSAERSYYLEDKNEAEELEARTFELANLKEIPEESRYQLAYRHATLLSQISPHEEQLSWVVARLKDTGLIEKTLTSEEKNEIEKRLKLAKNWADMYAPQEYKVKILDNLTDEVRSKLTSDQKTAVKIFAESIEDMEWNEDRIKTAMMELTKSGRLDISTSDFFKTLYLLLLGKDKGPRAAPFLSLLNKDFVLERLIEVDE